MAYSSSSSFDEIPIAPRLSPGRSSKSPTNIQLTFWMAHSAWFDGWLEWRSGDRKPGLAAMRNSLARQAEQGLITTFFETLLAEAEAEAGESDVAFCTINHALAASRANRAALVRCRNPSHPRRDHFSGATRPPTLSPPKKPSSAAIAVAGEQGARSFQLRAALSARQALSIDRPPGHRRSSGPLPCTRRLFADAGDARDR